MLSSQNEKKATDATIFQKDDSPPALPTRSCAPKESNDDDKEYHPVVFVTAKREYDPRRQMFFYRKPADLPKDVRIIYVDEQPSVCNRITSFFKSWFQPNENHGSHAKENSQGLKNR